MLTEILSGLWVGDVSDLDQGSFIEDNQIGVIINCTLFDLKIKQCNVQKIPISPDKSNNQNFQLLLRNMKQITRFIHSQIDTKNIFILGYDKSTVPSIIVGRYMIEYGQIPISNIKDILYSKKSDILIEIDFSIFD